MTQYRKFETSIPRKGSERPQSQFLPSCICERFTYRYISTIGLPSLLQFLFWEHINRNILQCLGEAVEEHIEGTGGRGKCECGSRVCFVCVFHYTQLLNKQVDMSSCRKPDMGYIKAQHGDETPSGCVRVKGTVRHVTGNDKDYLRLIPRVVW